MGGTSTTAQTQSSSTSPWAQGTQVANGLLGQLNPMIANSGITPGETNALGQIISNAGTTSQFNPQINNVTGSLLGGGGANNQAGNVNQAYQQYYNATNPLASNTNYDPMQTPGIGAQLQGVNDQITQQINGSFAGAGRDMSGYNQKALATGLAQGEAPILTNQYNANVANQQGAAGNLYNAGNSHAGILAGLQQQYLQNQQQGVQGVTSGLQAQNSGANSALGASTALQQLPAQTLGLLAQIGLPIAGLGSTSTGQGNGTNTMSGVQQLQGITSSLGSLFGNGGTGTGGTGSGILGGVKSFISDRRMKEDIDQVGTLFDGTPVYRFRYLGQPAFQIGLMAQDIEGREPKAVTEINGIKAVDYEIATKKALGVASGLA